MRKIIWAATGAALSLALAGCWTSDKLLFDRHSGVGVIADGTYAAADGSVIAARGEGHGWYVLSDASANATPGHVDDIPVLVTRVKGLPRDVYVFAAGASGCLNHSDACKSWTYGLIRLHDGKIDEAVPDCEKTAALVRRSGGRVHPPNEVSETTCDFHSVIRLKAALVALSRTADPYTRTYSRR